jgi:hypothetical protein
MDAFLGSNPFHGRDGGASGAAKGEKSFLVFDRRTSVVRKECEGAWLSTQPSSLFQEKRRVRLVEGNASQGNPLRTTV